MAPNTTSDFAFQGALRDEATAVWRGLIRVEKEAQKTNAYQENRNLMLSEKAHADSIPGLEILANDVRCTHGATLGQVDREQLFYLMSRASRERRRSASSCAGSPDILDASSSSRCERRSARHSRRASLKPERLSACGTANSSLNSTAGCSDGRRSRRHANPPRRLRPAEFAAVDLLRSEAGTGRAELLRPLCRVGPRARRRFRAREPDVAGESRPGGAARLFRRRVDGLNRASIALWRRSRSIREPETRS